MAEIDSSSHLVYKLKRGAQQRLMLAAFSKAGSQRALSSLVHIPRRSLREYLTEQRLLPPLRRKKILSFLDIPPDEFANAIELSFPVHWGQRKGGTISRDNLSQEQLRHYMLYMRSFRGLRTSHATFSLPLDERLMEFYGVLMGDGCLSKYSYKNRIFYDIVITGDKRHEHGYYGYLQNLAEELGISSYLYSSKSDNTVRLFIKNKLVSLFFIKLGYPIGRKSHSIKIPEKFVNIEWALLKYLMRGLFDTDGSLFARKRENYKYLHFTFSSQSDILLQQLYVILREKNYPVYLHKSPGKKNLTLRGNANIRRWMDEIGTSNPKHRFKYDHWLAHQQLPRLGASNSTR